MRPMPGLAVITGASSGLGREFAFLAAGRGYDLLLVARDATALESLRTEIEERYPVKALVCVADLSKPGAAEKIAEAGERIGPVTLLVNNAGFGGYGRFAETQLDREREMIEVNVQALTALTKLLLPDMLARKEGRILNVASTAAYQAGPLMAVYYATKAYVLSFSHALAEELDGSGVTVTCVCPGPTRTAFAKNAKLGSSKLFRHRVMDAYPVARAGFEGCMAGKREVIPGFTNKIGAFATRLVSRATAARVAKIAQDEA
jgi:uncharacterized protein